MLQHDVGRFYDALSATYDRSRFASPYHRHVALRESAFVLQWVGQRPGNVLEVGPGTGRFTALLAPRCDTLTACDISPGMLHAVRQRVGPAGHVVCLKRSVAQLRTVPGYGEFDVALAMRVIPHTDDWRAALQNLCRAVRPGGTVLFDLWNAHSFPALVRLLTGRGPKVRTHRLRPSQIQQTVAQLPVTIVATFRWGYPRLHRWHLDSWGARWLPHWAYATVFSARREPAR